APQPGGRAARRAAEEARLGREEAGGQGAPAAQPEPYRPGQGGTGQGPSRWAPNGAGPNGAGPNAAGANGVPSNGVPPNGAGSNGSRAGAPPRLGSWNDARSRQGLPGTGGPAATAGDPWSRSADPRSRSGARADWSRGTGPAPQDRAVQDRAVQDRAVQDRAAPDRQARDRQAPDRQALQDKAAPASPAPTRQAPQDSARLGPEQQFGKPRQPWARPDTSRPDTGRRDPRGDLTGRPGAGRPDANGLGLAGSAWPGETREAGARPGETRERETEQLGRLGGPAEAGEPLTAPFTAPDLDGGPPTQLGSPPVEEDDLDGGPPTQLGGSPLDEDDDEPDLAAPAGLGRADRVREDDETEDEGTPQGWAVVIGQWIAGALVGAGIWVGFRYLWFNLPVVALAAAVIITVGLVLGVRALLRNDDLRTTVFAVAVGLLLTVSPAILVLLER
ncbi:hypothetical protein, partial [Pseudonocardia xishanensis]|uniref:hypothetical protein n=1 Tax=Pseudonocardia xishanensis TaxID=630995 RepID=UPI0031E78647